MTLFGWKQEDLLKKVALGGKRTLHDTWLNF